KLGEINFDRAQYKPAEAYYDSALASLPKDHPDFDNIVARKKTLKSLVGYINTIAREDSLQNVAKMSSPLRIQYIDKIIEQYKKDEERRKAELKAQMEAPVS